MKIFFPEIRRIFDLTDDEIHGYPEESIQATEESLGIRLPTMLRQFYLELGVHRMNSLQDWIVSLDDLKNHEQVDDWLPFYFENQGVVAWAVNRKDCSQDDPPVYAQLDGDDWAMETKSVSLFLRTILHHQAIMGAYYREAAIAPFVDREVVEYVKANFPASDEQFQVWLKLKTYASSADGGIEIWTTNQLDLSIGAKTKERFLELYEPLRQLDIRWDFLPDWLNELQEHVEE